MNIVEQKLLLLGQKLPIIGSGAIATADPPSVSNLGAFFWETGDPNFPNGRLWRYKARNFNTKYLKEYADSNNGFNARWATAFRIPTTAVSAKIRIKLINKTASSTTVAAYGAVSNIDSSPIPSVGSSITQNPNTGWASLKINGDANLTVPANTTLWTDWIDVNMIDPLIGNSKIFVVHFVSVLNLRYLASSTGNGDIIDGWRSYNGMTSLSTAGTENTSNLTCLGYEIEDGVHRQTIVAIGDSLTQGWPSSSPWFGYTNKQYFLENNQGVAGSSSDTFITRLNNSLSLNPSLVLYSIYTPNDGSITQPIADTQKARFLQALTICRNNNIQLIPTWLCPNDNLNLTQDNLRKEVLNYAYALMGSKIDLLPAVAQGISPDRFIESLKNDNLHPNLDGYLAMRALYISMTDSLYVDYFIEPDQFA